MSTNPGDLKYSKEHEWVRVNGAQAIIGITSYAQKQLGDIVFIELPKVGASSDLGDPIGSIESVKAVAEIYMPLTGKIIKINNEVSDDPELVNTDPYGEGWLVELQIANTSQLKNLMSADQYEQYIKDEQE
jgi:glycine cleavage system H protein